MMISLRTTIMEFLEDKGAEAHFESAPETATFPYLVVSFLPSFKPDESREQLLVEIDGWDCPTDGDSTALETLMQTINGDGDLTDPSGLDLQSIAANDILALFRLESRLPVKNVDDPDILRRKYTYNTTVYERRTS